MSMLPCGRLPEFELVCPNPAELVIMSTLCDGGPCQGCRHASLAIQWGLPEFDSPCAPHQDRKRGAPRAQGPGGSGNDDWKLPWVAGTELESAQPVFRSFWHSQGSTSQPFHVGAPWLKLLYLPPDPVSDFQAMTTVRRLVFCGQLNVLKRSCSCSTVARKTLSWQGWTTAAAG